ncbi:3'-5' exonuclease [Acinetobacter modestus]|uniref:3'-5' exonuclease n=1 Tax=Acinetobacter modestus TaxID=1776740 RepID=UPI003017E9C4
MNAIILDTETHKMHGLPIQISYAPCSCEQGVVRIDEDAIYDQYYSVGVPIDFGAMAVHHIIEDDLIGKPSYDTFKLPESVEYIVGHNVHFDLAVIAKCGVEVGHLKPICTLAIARALFPELAHNLAALTYALAMFQDDARKSLKNAHNALTDIKLTANLLDKLAHELKKTIRIESLEDLYLYTQSVIIPTYITFGKHKGTALNNLPHDYVAWLLKQDDLDQFLRIGLENRKVR